MGGDFPHNKHISSAEYRLIRGVIDYNESVHLVKDNVGRINTRKVIRIFCNDQFFESCKSLLLTPSIKETIQGDRWSSHHTALVSKLGVLGRKSIARPQSDSWFSSMINRESGVFIYLLLSCMPEA